MSEHHTPPGEAGSKGGRLPAGMGDGWELRLLEVIQQLSAEMHPHRPNPRVEMSSALDSDLGFDSLSRVELLLRIEQHFDIALAEHVMASAETPADLARAMMRQQPLGAAGKSAMSAKAGEVAPLVLGDAEAVPERAETLQEVMLWHMEKQPDRQHVLFYTEDGGSVTMSYGELWRDASAVAAGLQAHGLQSGQTVSIMLPTSLEYFHCFLGILLAGGIPVPIYPPARPSHIEDHLRRHAKILDNARTPILITIPEAKIAARLLKMQVPSMQHILTTQELAATGATPAIYQGRGDDLAHLQYTSGSTGTPKGVMLSHANLLANIRTIGRVAGADHTDVFVSWLPLYHDMGLIGAWMTPMYYAMPLVLMSPLTFLARPDRWLHTISRHRGTVSGGPNFCFELCLNRVSEEQMEGLDLSSWRYVFNGAEPVVPNTIRRFTEKFAPYGLRQDAMMPLYGLAEAAVGLTFPPLGRPALIDRIQRDVLDHQGRAEPAAADDANALEFVACGQPLPGHEVRIVNETGQELGEREEGRLEFKGPSATSGYYRNPEAIKELFHGDWIDSGDMAYIAGGDIFITGRRKDIIIRAGRNIYPHELEEAIGNLEGVRKGCVAVFGTEDKAGGTEKLVALVETRETDAAAIEELNRRINALAVDLLGNPLDDVVLAPPHSVPKTSSGKLRRGSSRELYEQGAVGMGTRPVWHQVLRLWLGSLLPQISRWRRVVGDTLYGMWYLLLMGLMAPPFWLAALLMPSRKLSWGILQKGLRLLFWLSRTPITVQGMEHYPKGQPIVMCLNHSSYLDAIFVLGAMPGPLGFVAKAELKRNPFLRIIMARLGVQTVERFDKQRGAEDARRTAKVAQQGESLVFFPEGTVRRQPGLMPFHMGAFQAAVEANVPVLPVVMRGTRSILRDGHYLPRKGRVQFQVLAPIMPQGQGWQAAVDLRDQTRRAILAHHNEPDLIDHPVEW